MEYELRKVDAAVDQLDWAIRLLIDHRAYVPAITLAGAAEEILGAIQGKESAFALLIERLGPRLGMPAKVLSQQHLNRAKNWLKHWKNREDAEVIAVELETEAITYILRALANLAGHDKSLPSEGPRFLDWLTINRPDIHTD